jgi:hypothetical protein
MEILKSEGRETSELVRALDKVVAHPDLLNVQDIKGLSSPARGQAPVPSLPEKALRFFERLGRVRSDPSMQTPFTGRLGQELAQNNIKWDATQAVLRLQRTLQPAGLPAENPVFLVAVNKEDLLIPVKSLEETGNPLSPFQTLLESFTSANQQGRMQMILMPGRGLTPADLRAAAKDKAGSSLSILEQVPVQENNTVDAGLLYKKYLDCLARKTGLNEKNISLTLALNGVQPAKGSLDSLPEDSPFRQALSALFLDIQSRHLNNIFWLAAMIEKQA